MADGAVPERWLSRTASKAKRSFSVKKSIRRIVQRDDEPMPTGLDSGEFEYLCTVCTQLLTVPASQKKLFAKGGFSRGAPLYHGEGGCRLCTQVVEVLKARGFSETGDLSNCTLHALDKYKKYVQAFENFGHGYEGLHGEEKTSGPSELTQMSYLHVRAGNGDLKDITSESVLTIAPCYNDISEKMFTYPNPPIHNFDLAGDFLIRRARAQLRECRKNHIQCKGASGRLPKRVIDVHPSGDDSTVRLHLTGRHENMTYVALSYCWGGQQNVMTTTNTLGNNVVGIKKTDLDQTIQDAIIMTRKLGHHYLWVDSLCIIQDDPADKEMEIKSMDAIYGNATLTIAAAGSKAASEGFLGKSKASSLATRHSLPLRLPDGEMGFITAIAERTIKDRTGWPLDSRAWALSEFILSRRMLIFNDGDVRYQCRKADFAPVVPSPIKYDVRIPRLPKKHDELKAFLKVKWFDLVEDYTRRGLTYESDRLVAISPIVKQIQVRMAHGLDSQVDEYFVGLWKSCFAGNLLWCTSKPVLYESTTNNQPLITTPTFSWASTGAAVQFLGVLTNSVEFLQWGERTDASRTTIAPGQKFSTITVKAKLFPLHKLLLNQLPQLCKCDAVTLEDLKSVLHVYEDFDGKEGFELSDSSVFMRVDDGANSKDNRGLILNRVEGKYFRRIGAYSELDWDSRPKDARVDESRNAMITKLQKVISTPAAWEGYTTAELILV